MTSVSGPKSELWLAMGALGEHEAGHSPTTSEALRSPWRFFREVFVYALLLAVVALGWACVSLWTQLDELTARLERDDSNLTLSVQAADELFRLMLTNIDSSQPLTDGERQLLRSWILLDDQFYEQNQDNPELRFECATALLRIGQAEVLLGSHQSASRRLEGSFELFAGLLDQRPRVHGLRLDAVTTANALGQCRRELGDIDGAIEAFETAQRLLSASRIPLDTESGAVMLAIHESLAAVCLEAGNHAAATSALTAALRIRQRMWQAGQQDSESAAQLAELQVQLVRSMERLNQPQQFEETLQDSLVQVQQLAGRFPDQPELQQSLESLQGFSPEGKLQ